MAKQDILTFDGEFRFLSNFYSSPFVYGDVIYPTVENFYQAMKTKDQAKREHIATLSPGKAKGAGRSLVIREDWEGIKVDVMLLGLRKKFGEHEGLRNRLMATYPAHLQEGNTWGDKFWGVCNGEGENNLGKLLMQVRDEMFDHYGFMVMGTGSRSAVTDENPKAIYDHLEARVLQLHEQFPNLVLISGMAEGWDEMIASVGYRNEIPYDVYLPHPTYGEYYWRDHSVKGHDRYGYFQLLVRGARRVHIVSQTLYVGTLHANFVRNARMVEMCDMALVYKPTSSGTRDAVGRLVSARKPYEVYPFSLQEELDF